MEGAICVLIVACGLMIGYAIAAYFDNNRNGD